MKSNLKTSISLSIVMIFSLSVMACNNNKAQDHSSAATAPENTVNPDSTSIANVSVQDDDLSLFDEHKRLINVSELKGKVVFINFWATWCPPCIEEMPSINKLKQHYKDNPNVVFVMVDVDGDYEKSKKFMQKKKFDLPLYIANGDIPERFLGTAIPTTVVLDKSGHIAARLEGGRDYNTQGIKDGLNELLAN